MIKPGERDVTVDEWAEEMRIHLEEFVKMAKANRAEYPERAALGDWDEWFLIYAGDCDQ